MIQLDGEDWELQQIGKQPDIGYSYEYITKTTVDGIMHRMYRGRRFFANISFAWLTDEQTTRLLSLLNKTVVAKIQTPIDEFNGDVFVEIKNMPKRFDVDKWTNWQISITGVNLIQ